MSLVRLLILSVLFLGSLVLLGPVYAQEATPTATPTSTPVSPSAAPSTGFGPGM